MAMSHLFRQQQLFIATFGHDSHLLCLVVFVAVAVAAAVVAAVVAAVAAAVAVIVVVAVVGYDQSFFDSQ